MFWIVYFVTNFLLYRNKNISAINSNCNRDKNYEIWAKRPWNWGFYWRIADTCHPRRVFLHHNVFVLWSSNVPVSASSSYLHSTISSKHSVVCATSVTLLYQWSKLLIRMNTTTLRTIKRQTKILHQKSCQVCSLFPSVRPHYLAPTKKSSAK